MALSYLDNLRDYPDDPMIISYATQIAQGDNFLLGRFRSAITYRYACSQNFRFLQQLMPRRLPHEPMSARVDALCCFEAQEERTVQVPVTSAHGT